MVGVDWGAVSCLCALGTLKYLTKTIYMEIKKKYTLGCMFSSRLETKTKPYRSMYCITNNVRIFITLLVVRQY